MPELATPGIHIAEIPNAEQPIARAAAAVTAFVGRALRGPVNVPVPVRSFADYQQVFGGLWQPSTLSYAVEHFFEQGGRNAVVVRVANGGAPPTISLRCADGMLTLEALSAGTREFLRAAVDYDNIGDNEDDQFNLVLQRVRAPDSERIEEQEIYRRISSNPATHRYVAAVLAESRLVRVRGEVPLSRPEPTFVPGSRQPAGYQHSNPDGNDGDALSDYDVIGSARDGTGLFALAAVDNLSYLYIPPLSRGVDLGVSTLLVAARFCRERRAMLILDPPAGWVSPMDAIRAMRELNFYTDHAVMFFPRIVATDRLRGRSEVFANGGAVAGLLARAEEQRPVWAVGSAEPELILRSGVRLAGALSEADRWRLVSNGINALHVARSTALVRPVPRTLAGGANAAADWGYLPMRRFALFVVNSIERGTRWVVLSPAERAVWQRVTRQVAAFFKDLFAVGSFPSLSMERAFFVICDERVNSAEDARLGRLNILVGFAASRAGEYHCFMITHQLGGSSVRQVAVNRLETSAVIELDAGPFKERLRV